MPALKSVEKPIITPRVCENRLEFFVEHSRKKLKIEEPGHSQIGLMLLVNIICGRIFTEILVSMPVRFIPGTFK